MRLPFRGGWLGGPLCGQSDPTSVTQSGLEFAQSVETRPAGIRRRHGHLISSPYRRVGLRQPWGGRSQSRGPFQQHVTLRLRPREEPQVIGLRGLEGHGRRDQQVARAGGCDGRGRC